MKTTTRILSIIIILALLAGCAPVPTPAPTATATPLPTATPTPAPTATAIPTPVIAAMPGLDDPYPTSTLIRTSLTTADIDGQKTAFADLMKAEPYVALEAEALENKLQQIGGPDTRTTSLVDGTRWGVFAQKKDGTPLILQKTTDGGKTWVNVIDASAYSELVAQANFDPDNYRLIPLNRPAGIPKDAKIGVIAENNWMVYVFRDTEGSIIAWYDAANDVFKTVQGEELKIQEVSYIPYETGQTWEQVQKNNVVHWPLDNPEQFEKELAALHKLDIQLEPTDLATVPEGAKNYVQTNGQPTGWLWFGCQTYSMNRINRHASVAASLQNPNGDEMVIVMSQLSVTLANGEERAFFIPTVRDTNLLLNYIKKSLGEKDPLYTQSTSANYIKSLHGYDLVTIKSVISKTPLNTPNLPKEYQMLAQLYDYNTEIGVTQAFERLVNGEGTDEDIQLIQHSGIIPVFETQFEDRDT